MKMCFIHSSSPSDVAKANAALINQTLSSGMITKMMPDMKTTITIIVN